MQSLQIRDIKKLGLFMSTKCVVSHLYSFSLYFESLTRRERVDLCNLRRKRKINFGPSLSLSLALLEKTKT